MACQRLIGLVVTQAYFSGGMRPEKAFAYVDMLGTYPGKIGKRREEVLHPDRLPQYGGSQHLSMLTQKIF